LLPVFGLFLVDALGLNLVQTGAKNAHSLFAIFDLRFFVLATDDRVRGQMGNADGGVSSVDGLAAGAGGAESVDAEVLGLDFDVDLFGLGQDRHGDGGGVNAALGFRRWDALDAMDSRLV